MINFSGYLKKNHIRVLTKQDIEGQLFAWCDEIREELKLLREFFPVNFLALLFNSSEARMGLFARFKHLLIPYSDPLSPQTIDELIARIDEGYTVLIQLLKDRSKLRLLENPREVEPNFYPLASKVTGVEMLVRMRTKNGTLLPMPNFFARSAVGSNASQSREIKKRVALSTKKSSCSWLEEALAEQKHVEIVDKHNPHAEDDWFSLYGDRLLALVKENKNELDNPNASDELLISHLKGARIEFMMSTSPCTDCQPYFQALRHILNKHDIKVPIVVFADSHYNTGENDCANYVVTFSGEYRSIPGQWHGPSVVSKNLPVLISDNFNAQYQALFTLNVFGEQLLPLLANSRFYVIHSLIIGLLNVQATNSLMLDWTKFYLGQVLRVLPPQYDFSKTEMAHLMEPDTYEVADYHFMRTCLFNKDVRDYLEPIAAMAGHKNNALIFFDQLAKHVAGGFLSILDRKMKGSSSTRLSPELQQLIDKTEAMLLWDVDSAPSNYVKHVADLEETMLWNDQLAEFIPKLSVFFEYMHFISVAPQYQNNILNSILTHPADSPLGAKNGQLNNQQIAQLIYQARTAIYQIACKEGTWDLGILENIFKAFRNKIFYPPLLEAMNQIPATTRHQNVSLERIFNQEQVYLSSIPHCIKVDGDDVYNMYFPEVEHREQISDDMIQERIALLRQGVEQTEQTDDELEESKDLPPPLRATPQQVEAKDEYLDESKALQASHQAALSSTAKILSIIACTISHQPDEEQSKPPDITCYNVWWRKSRARVEPSVAHQPTSVGL